jgi:hypothetical protein
MSHDEIRPRCCVREIFLILNKISFNLNAELNPVMRGPRGAQSDRRGRLRVLQRFEAINASEPGLSPQDFAE